MVQLLAALRRQIQRRIVAVTLQGHRKRSPLDLADAVMMTIVTRMSKLVLNQQGFLLIMEDSMSPFLFRPAGLAVTLLSFPTSTTAYGRALV